MGVVDRLSFDVQGRGGFRPIWTHSDRQKRRGAGGGGGGGVKKKKKKKKKTAGSGRGGAKIRHCSWMP